MVDLYSHDVIMWDQEFVVADSELFSLDQDSNDSNYSSSSSVSTASTVIPDDPLYSPHFAVENPLDSEVKRGEWNEEGENMEKVNKKKRKRRAIVHQSNLMVTRSQGKANREMTENKKQVESQATDIRGQECAILGTVIRVPVGNPEELLERSKRLEYHLNKLKDRVDDEEEEEKRVIEEEEEKQVLRGSKRQKLAEERIEKLKKMEEKIEQSSVEFYQMERELSDLQKRREEMIWRMESQKLQNSQSLMHETVERHYQQALEKMSTSGALNEECSAVKNEFQRVQTELGMIEKMSLESTRRGLNRLVVVTSHHQNFIIECLYKKFVEDVKQIIREMMRLKLRCTAITVPNMVIIRHLFRQLLLEHKIGLVQTNQEEIDSQYNQLEEYNSLVFSYLILTNEFLADPGLLSAFLAYQVRTLY